MKCTREEWDLTVKLAGALADALSDPVMEKKARRKYFSYMHRLLRKYGDDANILASIGDFYQYDRAALNLLKRAYESARKEKDEKNLTLISASIASRLIRSGDGKAADCVLWTGRLRRNLERCEDELALEEYRECRRMLRERKISGRRPVP